MRPIRLGAVAVVSFLTLAVSAPGADWPMLGRDGSRTLHLLPRMNERLLPQLAKLKPGSRIICHANPIPGARADKVIAVVSQEGKLGKRTRIDKAGERVRFADGGKTLICADAFGIESLDVRTGKIVRKWDYPERRVDLGGGKKDGAQSLEVSPDGRLLACRMQRMIPSK